MSNGKKWHESEDIGCLWIGIACALMMLAWGAMQWMAGGKTP